jgi:hypothetical protein
MNAACLRFCTLERRKLHGLLVYDWLPKRVREASLALFHVRFAIESRRTREA